jgi:tetratricopeptide (TPR) repeat protein
MTNVRISELRVLTDNDCMSRALFAMTAAAMLSPFAAAADWIKVSSANFEIYTPSSQGEARRTLETFEQVRDFFMRVRPSSVTTRLPVTIVGFRNPKEYAPYTPNQSAAAYYTGDEQRDYIVMGDLAPENTPVAVHEYMHLLVRHSGLKMPVWLNEGFAEVYSTLRPLAGEILLGAVPRGRDVLLSQQKWLPLSRVGQDSLEYNEKSRAGIFYAESWLLTHMLMLGDDYRSGFPKFVAAISETQSTEEALSLAYGKRLAEIQEEMQAYLRTGSLKGALFKTRFQKVRVEPGRAATDLEIGLTLAKLTALLRHYDEAVERYQRLAETNRDNLEIEEALAYLYWRKGELNAARDHFGRAMSLGATSWKTYWDYARLLASNPDGDEQRMEALRKTLSLKPDLIEARLMLGQELYRKRSWAQAFVTLREIRNIDAERAPALFLMLAYAAVNLDRQEEAKQYAADARKHAREARQIDDAERLLEFLNRPAAPAAPEGRPQSAPVSRHRERSGEEPPRLQRRAPPTTTFTELAPAEPRYLTVKGRLKRFDCLGDVARMHVSAEGKTHVLLIRTPDRIQIRNGTGAPVNMTCGPQDTPISVDYLPHADAAHNSTGDVYAIELLN